MKSTLRIGNGFDVHKLETGRQLIIGGVCIPFEKGLHGHSDADVLIHAIADACLGAVAMGDIGKHFPDTDAKYKNADSRKILRYVVNLVTTCGFTLVNIDSVIIAQAPRMADHIDQMRANIADDTGLELDQVSVKATTTEQLGFTGRGEGIASYATVLVDGCRN